MLSLPSAHYRCTSCGDCCRGWDVPLQEGEAESFQRLAATVIPAERLVKAIGHARQGTRDIETLAGAGQSCPALQEDQLCAIHGKYGEASKPKACRIFPFTFVSTPTSVRVGLSYACPAVIDAEGTPLTEQRAEVDAVFAAAVDGTRYLLRIGDEVRLGDGVKLPWADAEVLIAELATAVRKDGTLLERVCGAGAICALTETQLQEGASFAVALEGARAGAAALVEEVLATPPEADRLSRALFRTLLKSTELGHSAVGRMGNLFSSLLGGGSVHLRTGGEVAWRAVEAVPPGLGAEGEALLARWFAGALESCTFFGDAAFDLSLAGGLDLLVLSASVCAFLARAYAAHESRTAVTYEDVKRGLRQLDAGLTHRGTMPRGFDRALAVTASLDLLRTQLS